MANTNASYSDAQIVKALLTRDFSSIGREFVDDLITSVKAAAFLEAQNLDKVSLPSAKVINAYAFQNAALTTIDLPWEELEAIGTNAFMGAAGYPQNLVLSNLTALNGGSFVGTNSNKNTQLRTISLPKWTGSTLSGGAAFGNSTSGIFSYCSALQSISAPELQSIPSYMCQYCTALEEAVFPKVSSVSSNAFSNCTNLTKIEFGGAITKLSSGFMSSASKMTALILRGVTTVPTISSTTFSSTAVKSGTCYVYVPKSLEAAFKVASNWSTYASQIRAIEDYPDICGS